MLQVLPYRPQYDVAPQAIFWRPLLYFTTKIREGEDGLDLYKGASFTYGNRIQFDLRSYRGNPQQTVTMYLPVNVRAMRHIDNTITVARTEMAIPRRAIAWRRGQDF